MTESILVSLATGSRPKTAEIALKALEQSLAPLQADFDVELHIGLWAINEKIAYVPKAVSTVLFEIDKGIKPEIVNRSLHSFGKTPTWWVTLDDDVVISDRTIPNLISVIRDDEHIGLAGAWNDHSEREPIRGKVRTVANHQVQYDDGGNAFCVGGALHLIPGSVVDKLGPYMEIPRHEDAEYSHRVRQAGMHAVLVRTSPVVVLPDDGVNSWYRGRIKAMDFGYDPRRDRE